MLTGHGFAKVENRRPRPQPGNFHHLRRQGSARRTVRFLAAEGNEVVGVDDFAALFRRQFVAGVADQLR